MSTAADSTGLSLVGRFFDAAASFGSPVVVASCGQLDELSMGSCGMMVVMRIRSGIDVDDEVLAQFCQRHHISRLALYGSSLRGDFSSGSDLDVLVEFEPGHVPGLLRLAGMEIELGDLLAGSEVELRTYEDLSRFFRDEVRASARQFYAA